MFVNIYILIICIKLICTNDDLIVETDSGLLTSDLVFTSRNGTTYFGFLGVPYAAPPVGQLRFEPPQLHDKWNDVRKTVQFSPECPQIDMAKSSQEHKMVLRGNEDCLYLNIFTPQVKRPELMPVLVFIHGGTFISGSGKEYNLINFMDFPIVAVTFNYRLGILGFLSSGDNMLPGNYGLKDQVAVLKWVQKNIKNFGGDPLLVTIMGESTGGHNVHHHTLSKASTGLFHQAIIMSGSALSLWSYYPKQNNYAKYTFKHLLKHVKCDMGGIKNIRGCLKVISFQKLKNAEYAFEANKSIPFVFRPVLELEQKDAFLVNDPRELQYPNPNIPVLVGSCSTEGFMNTLIFMSHYENGNYNNILDHVLPLSLHYQYWVQPTEVNTITKMLKEFYFPDEMNIGRKSVSQFVNLYGNILFLMPTVETTRSYPGIRYQYVYDYTNNASLLNLPVAKAAHLHGASHGDDLISLFTSELFDNDLEVSQWLVKYFTNFIRFKNPNYGHSQSTVWEPVSSKSIEYLHISSEGFNMRGCLACDNNFTFYESLPIKWHSVSSGTTESVPYLYFNIVCVMVIVTILHSNTSNSPLVNLLSLN